MGMESFGEETVGEFEKSLDALDRQALLIQEQKKSKDHSLLTRGKRWVTLALVGITLVGAGCRRETAESKAKGKANPENVQPHEEDRFERAEREEAENDAETARVKVYIESTGVKVLLGDRVEISKKFGLLTSIKVNGEDIPIPLLAAKLLKAEDERYRLDSWQRAHPGSESAETSESETTEDESISPAATQFLSDSAAADKSTEENISPEAAEFFK